MKFTGTPIQQERKLTLEERVEQLEKQLYEPYAWRSEPLWKRHLDVAARLQKLAEHLGFEWFIESAPTKEGWRKKRWWK